MGKSQVAHLSPVLIPLPASINLYIKPTELLFKAKCKRPDFGIHCLRKSFAAITKLCTVLGIVNLLTDGRMERGSYSLKPGKINFKSTLVSVF